MADDPLDVLANEIRADEPRITDAMKNYISYLGGSAIVATSEDSSNIPPLDLGQLTTCAKVALKQINAHMLLPSAEWAIANPQGEDELGTDRIDALTRYKACILLAGQATSAGGKVTKLLGRKYLRATKTWSQVAPRVTSELLSLEIPPTIVEHFVAGFSGALEQSDESEDVASLVWSSDFQAKLRARQEARQAEILGRRERMLENEDQATMLREALISGGEEEMERIVEVDAS
mmetsp:Transcript_2521/g.7005  ORF Transcript_2521/g.7005 Transcript_2521/m.7005 type:complete len:234 (-) Transcript_2521:96-797(-)